MSLTDSPTPPTPSLKLLVSAAVDTLKYDKISI